MDAERQRAADVKSDVHLEDHVVDGAEVGSEVDRGAAREILRGCVFSRTRMLDRALSRIFDNSLAPLRVRASQLTVLALIAAMEGLRAADVARYLEMDKSTVSRSLAGEGLGGGVGLADQETESPRGHPRRASAP